MFKLNPYNTNLPKQVTKNICQKRLRLPVIYQYYFFKLLFNVLFWGWDVPSAHGYVRDRNNEVSEITLRVEELLLSILFFGTSTRTILAQFNLEILTTNCDIVIICDINFICHIHMYPSEIEYVSKKEFHVLIYTWDIVRYYSLENSFTVDISSKKNFMLLNL